MKKFILYIACVFLFWQTSQAANFSRMNCITDNNELTLSFKFLISDTLIPVKFHFLLGSMPGLSDVKDQTAEIIKNNNNYVLYSEGSFFPVKRNGIEISFTLKRNEYEMLSYITIIGEDENGLKSEIGIYNIK